MFGRANAAAATSGSVPTSAVILILSLGMSACAWGNSGPQQDGEAPAAPERSLAPIGSNDRPSTSVAVAVEPEAETDIATLAQYVETQTGLTFVDEPVVDYSSTDPGSLELDAAFFADAEMWRLLTVVGVIEPGADRLLAAQARIDQIRGACCPVQLFETDDHPLLTSVVVVHELTHLVDQERLSQMPFRPGDEVVGFATAVSEGNAQRVASAYRRTLEDAGAPAERFAVDWSHPDVPDAFLQILEFPYDEGYTFSSGLEAVGGLDLVDESFRRPPVSSKQILDVDAYIAAEWPTPVRPPDDGEGELLQRGVVGAFVLKLMLERSMAADDALEVATQWSGDAYTIYNRDGETCLDSDLVMESDSSAEQVRLAVVDLGFEASRTARGSLRMSRCVSADL